MSRATRSACAALLLCLTAICAVATLARAATPTVDYLYPAGGGQGTTVSVTAGIAKGDATIDHWPAKVWTDAPGLVFKAEKKNGTFTATIAEDVTPGPHLVRIYNADGPSAPRIFIVSARCKEQLEKENAGKDSNDNAADAQPAGDLPAVLNGRLEKADVDSWSLQAEAGKWIVAELVCRRLNAPIDPSLQLLDPDGTVVAFAHDTFGLDPLVAHQATRSGRYVLQVSGFTYPPAADIRFGGSKAAIYRLAVTTGPYARFALPSCIAREGKTKLRLFGWNLGEADASGLPIEADAAQTPAGADHILISNQIDNVLRVPLSNVASTPETEPNDSPAAAQAVEAPAGIDGQLGRRGDVDCFALEAHKGDRFIAKIRATSLGSPIDPVLTAIDPAGKQIARANDAAGRDTQIAWTAAADGKYVVTVADLAHRGGREYVYRLEVTHPGDDFTATADKDAYTLAAGKSVDVKVNINRQTGDETAFSIAVTGLPEGVTATAPDIAGKSSSATVTLKAAADADASQQPFSITVSPQGKSHAGPRQAVFVLGQDQLIESTGSLWLRVVGKGN